MIQSYALHNYMNKTYMQKQMFIISTQIKGGPERIPQQRIILKQNFQNFFNVRGEKEVRKGGPDF